MNPKIPRYIAFVVGTLCSAKVIFTSAGLGVSIYQLTGELTQGEIARSTAYRVIICFSIVAFLVGVLSLVQLLLTMKGKANQKYTAAIIALATIAFTPHLLYAYVFRSSVVNNLVLLQFADGFTWLPLIGIVGAAMPLVMWLLERKRRA
jgi:uncharacterized protein with PQ loop repeat